MTGRCGFVALLGSPNVGKSTLLNRLTGAKVAIVSSKPQTTQFPVRGIVVREKTQVLLVDTPGIFAPRHRLDRAMVTAAWEAARDADIAVLVVDAKAGITAPLHAMSKRLWQTVRAPWLVLNKIDLVARPSLLPLAETMASLAPFARTFMVSAVTGDGTDALLQSLVSAMPDGPHLYPDDDLSDLSDGTLAAEIVREQVFQQAHGEVPCEVTVETAGWAERRDGSVRIDATIYVSRPGQKAILIGSRGTRIREIGSRARVELVQLLERPVHLYLAVKERPVWQQEAARLGVLGLAGKGRPRAP